MGFRDEIKQQSKDVYKEVKDANSFNPLKENIDDGYRMNEQVASDITEFIKEIFKVKIDKRDYHKEQLWGSYYWVRLVCYIYIDDRGIFPDLEIGNISSSNIGMPNDGYIRLTFHSIKDLERMIPIIISSAKNEFDRLGNMGIVVVNQFNKPIKTEFADIVPLLVNKIKKNIFNNWTSGTLPSNERSHSYVIAHFSSVMNCNRKGIIT